MHAASLQKKSYAVGRRTESEKFPIFRIFLRSIRSTTSDQDDIADSSANDQVMSNDMAFALHASTDHRQCFYGVYQSVLDVVHVIQSDVEVHDF